MLSGEKKKKSKGRRRIEGRRGENKSAWDKLDLIGPLRPGPLNSDWDDSPKPHRASGESDGSFVVHAKLLGGTVSCETEEGSN
jgi:hypothetical protein